MCCSGSNPKTLPIRRGLVRAADMGRSNAIYIEGSVVQAGGDMVRVEYRDPYIHFERDGPVPGGDAHAGITQGIDLPIGEAGEEEVG